MKQNRWIFSSGKAEGRVRVSPAHQSAELSSRTEWFDSGVMPRTGHDLVDRLDFRVALLEPLDASQFERSNLRMAFGRSNSAARVNVYDVAAAAGVSHQTVSNVLNYPDRVRPATRDRVEAVIRDLGYEVNAAARSLGAGRSKVLGLQVPRTKPGAPPRFFEHFTLQLADAARARHHNILIFSSDDEGAGESSRLHRARLIDGVVVGDTVLHDRRMDELRASGVPFATFGRTADAVDYPWVDVDNRHAMELCVAHLVERGHRRIGYIDSAAETFYGNERREGLNAALVAAGLRLEPAHVLAVGNDLAEARTKAEELLGAPDAPTAVVAGSDYLAAAVLEAARVCGLDLGPQAFAIIGFDDTSLGALLSPPLTTIQQPLDEVARLLVDALVDAVAGNRPTNRLLQPRLVVRGSA